MAKRLEDRVAIVTGSDSGNGQAIADEFAREGADVAITWLHDRDGAEEPWEIAKLAAYLASDDADYVTGQTFTIDGGLSINLGQGA